jgi:putative hydrolase of the HAD superfamily
MNAPLRHVREWVFDLDNTLYPAPALYDAIGERMTAFIERACDVSAVDALELRERYFHRYGATVVGLAIHHGVNAHEFLAYVHNTDYSVLEPDGELAQSLAALPGRRIVFTNGGGGHAERTLAALGLAELFHEVFDIEDAGLAPKPTVLAYRRLIESCSVAPERALFVEDTLKNLEPAFELGFTTALVGPVHPQPKPEYLHHWAPDVKTLLREKALISQTPEA